MSIARIIVQCPALMFLFCCGSMSLAGDDVDKINAIMRKTVIALDKATPIQRRTTAHQFSYDSIMLAALIKLTPETFKEDGFGGKYHDLSKLFTGKDISHMLILIAIEEFDKKGTMYYGFFEKDDDFSETVKQINDPKSQFYKIDLSDDDATSKFNNIRPKHWLSRDVYKFNLLSTTKSMAMVIDEFSVPGVVAFSPMRRESVVKETLTIVRPPFTVWSHKDKISESPQDFIDILYSFALFDFLDKFEEILAEDDTDRVNAMMRKTIVALDNSMPKPTTAMSPHHYDTIMLALLIEPTSAQIKKLGSRYYGLAEYFESKTNPYMLILMAIEKFDEKGIMYYAFFEKTDDFSTMAKKLNSPDSPFYKFDLSNYSVTKNHPYPESANAKYWLSRDGYKIQLSLPTVEWIYHDANNPHKNETSRDFVSCATVALTTIRGKSEEGVTIIKSDAMTMGNADKGYISPPDFANKLSHFALYDFLSNFQKIPEK